MPIINQNELQKMTDGDMDLVADLAIMFVQKLPEILARIRNGYNSGDLAEVAFCAHQLKSRVSYFGAASIHEHVDRCEELAEAGDSESLAKILSELPSQVRQLVVELRELTGLELQFEEEESVTGVQR